MHLTITSTTPLVIPGNHHKTPQPPLGVDDYQGGTFSATPINSDLSERTVFLTAVEKFETAGFQPIHENLSGDLAVQKLLLSAYHFE